MTEQSKVCRISLRNRTFLSAKLNSSSVENQTYDLGFVVIVV